MLEYLKETTKGEPKLIHFEPNCRYPTAIGRLKEFEQKDT